MLKAANDRAAEIEQRCSKENQKATRLRQEAQAYKYEQKILLSEEKKRINALAEEKIADYKKKLSKMKEKEVSFIKENYDSETKSYKSRCDVDYGLRKAWHSFVFIFCIIWLIIQSVFGKYFIGDAVEIGTWIKNYSVFFGYKILEIASKASTIASGVNNETAATILTIVIQVLLIVVLGSIIYIAPIVAIIIGCTKYFGKSKRFDKANQWIMIGTGILATAISYGFYPEPPFNLLLTWLIVQVTVPVIRYVIVPLIGSFINRYQEMSAEEKKDIAKNVVILIVTVIGITFVIYCVCQLLEDIFW